MNDDIRNDVAVLLTHIEDVLDDEAWAAIDVGKWNAVSRQLAAPVRERGKTVDPAEDLPP